MGLAHSKDPSSTMQLRCWPGKTIHRRILYLRAVSRGNLKASLPSVNRNILVELNKGTAIMVCWFLFWYTQEWSSWHADLDHTVEEEDGVVVKNKAKALFRENYPRLQELKKKYDPERIFNRWFPITPSPWRCIQSFQIVVYMYKSNRGASDQNKDRFVDNIWKAVGDY